MENDCISGILTENLKRERRLSKYACRSRKGQRRNKEEMPDRENIRPVFAHDADRIMHSKAYARYIDKTQVFYLFENDHITHRVLHVQFVSRIGRTIGRALRLNEDLIEAIALGHDLGHVPYGHDGERILDKICRNVHIGGFGHNIQSVRWLMELERKGKGWNLTLQILDGILAHNGEMLHREYIPQYYKTWDQFEDEYQRCMQDPNYSKKILPMTIEGCVVRISDVIAYIGRDIEDAITIGLINRSDIPDTVVSVLGNTNREIINNLAMDLIYTSHGKDHLEFSSEVFEALSALKDFNYREIYHNSKIKTESHKIDHMFEHLVEAYTEDLRKQNQGSVIFSEFLNGMGDTYLQNNAEARIVVDFIAGMTDDFFNNQYRDRFVPMNLGYGLRHRKT